MTPCPAHVPAPRRSGPRKNSQPDRERCDPPAHGGSAVGDCIISRPLSQLAGRDARFAGVLRLIREAGAAFGNFETPILDPSDIAAFPHGASGDWTLLAQPEVARDLKAMGFDLLGRSNNHALDWGIEGMHEPGRRLDVPGVIRMKQVGAAVRSG